MIDILDQCDEKISYEIEKQLIENTEEEIDNLTSSILSYPASFSLEEYNRRFNANIFYKPEFQRNSVWDQRGKSRFIESLFFEYPIPQIFLYKEVEKETYMIIDGYQRITTINEFLEDKFSLKDVNINFVRKKFSELPYKYQEKLKSTQLSSWIIRQIEPSDVNILYNIFERLNTGGQNLNNMEIRRAVNYGYLIKELEKLNTNSNWLNILGKNKVDNRYLDVELLLRLTAFYYDWNRNELILNSYKTSMKPYLNEFCYRNKDKDITEFKDKFEKVVQQIIDELGTKPFTIYTRPNYVLLDSIITALILSNNPISNLKERVEKLKENSEYKEIYEAKQGTISVKNVNNRLKIAYNKLNND